ncbi:MAG: hypothetical protein GEU82_16515 [Luteitalea sp.]|nr:hypothetical protein [Luteitalea sp.]
MRLPVLLVAAILATAPAEAQTPAPPAPSSPETTTSPPKDVPPADLPVSLDHIREALKKPAEPSLLKNAELPADFRVEIVEQRKIDEMLSNLDFGGGPVPAGGLYSFEQQQRLFRPTDRPLMQPYAAFNGGQFITIALQNLIARYLGGRAIDAVSSAERARAERAAREEVDGAVAKYCASRPDRSEIQLCSNYVPAR